jgi:hypothetical protein
MPQRLAVTGVNALDMAATTYWRRVVLLLLPPKNGAARTGSQVCLLETKPMMGCLCCLRAGQGVPISEVKARTKTRPTHPSRQWLDKGKGATCCLVEDAPRKEASPAQDQTLEAPSAAFLLTWPLVIWWCLVDAWGTAGRSSSSTSIWQAAGHSGLSGSCM